MALGPYAFGGRPAGHPALAAAGTRAVAAVAPAAGCRDEQKREPVGDGVGAGGGRRATIAAVAVVARNGRGRVAAATAQAAGRPDIHLVVVGRGEFRGRIRRAAGRCRLKAAEPAGAADRRDVDGAVAGGGRVPGVVEREVGAGIARRPRRALQAVTAGAAIGLLPQRQLAAAGAGGHAIGDLAVRTLGAVAGHAADAGAAGAADLIQAGEGAVAAGRDRAYSGAAEAATVTAAQLRRSSAAGRPRPAGAAGDVQCGFGQPGPPGRGRRRNPGRETTGTRRRRLARASLERDARDGVVIAGLAAEPALHHGEGVDGAGTRHLHNAVGAAAGGAGLVGGLAAGAAVGVVLRGEHRAAGGVGNVQRRAGASRGTAETADAVAAGAARRGLIQGERAAARRRRLGGVVERTAGAGTTRRRVAPDPTLPAGLVGDCESDVSRCRCTRGGSSAGTARIACAHAEETRATDRIRGGLGNQQRRAGGAGSIGRRHPAHAAVGADDV